jgi:hypothetical protein
MGNIRVALASSGAIGALGLGLRQVPWPDEPFWQRNGGLVALLLVLVFLGSLSAIFETIRANRRARTQDLELAIQTPLNALFVSLLDVVGGAHYQSLGVHAFLVRWRMAWGWPPVRRELVRMGGVKLRAAPRSGVRWIKGKGLIGRCWVLNQDVGVNLDDAWRDLVDLPEAEWDDLPARIRYDMSFHEFQRTRAYRAIIASPIQDKSGRFRGCISIDSTADLHDALWATRPREAMQDAAQVISHLAKLS